MAKHAIKRPKQKRPARTPTRRRAATMPQPTPLDEETAAIQQERHGALDEAMEPPPRRGGDDIQRE